MLGAMMVRQFSNGVINYSTGSFSLFSGSLSKLSSVSFQTTSYRDLICCSLPGLMSDVSLDWVLNLLSRLLLKNSWSNRMDFPETFFLPLGGLGMGSLMLRIILSILPENFCEQGLRVMMTFNLWAILLSSCPKKVFLSSALSISSTSSYSLISSKLIVPLLILLSLKEPLSNLESNVAICFSPSSNTLFFLKLPQPLLAESESRLTLFSNDLMTILMVFFLSTFLTLDSLLDTLLTIITSFSTSLIGTSLANPTQDFLPSRDSLLAVSDESKELFLFRILTRFESVPDNIWFYACSSLSLLEDKMPT